MSVCIWMGLKMENFKNFCGLGVNVAKESERGGNNRD
jgi:hypothetical protein